MDGTRTAWARDTRRLLHTLPGHGATVLSLMYFARLSEAQICARTGWSEHLVRAASAAGLRELGQLLEAQSDGATTPAAVLSRAGRPPH